MPPPWRRQRLNVTLPSQIEHLAPSSSAGNMWHHVVAELRGLGTTVRFDQVDRAPWHRSASDVWLIDGHSGPIRSRRPVVAHLHEAPWEEADVGQQLSPEFREAGWRASDAAAQEARMIITPSEFSRRQVVAVHRLPEERVRAIPHGVDGHIFNPSRQEAGERLVLAAGGRTPYVAFVSVLHPRKNLGALRTAMSILAAQGFPHGLVLVVSPAADRQDYATMLSQAREDLPGAPGRVLVMQGLTELDLASVIAGASALCTPSLSEGFGLPALEAMASGTPVVVSNRGSLPEVVGEAGLVVEPDAESIAAALGRVLDSPTLASELNKAGLHRSSGFTWTASARQWHRVIEEAAER